MKNILIVEDDVEIIELLSLALTAKGYNVIEAGDGAIGYEKFRTHHIDLILTDAMMPNIDGYQFVKLVRIDDKQIPIIMLTALKAEADELNGFDSGVNDYVAKPFSFDILLKRIENQLVISASKIEETASVEETEIIDGPIHIDLERYTLEVEGNPVSLTKKEFMLIVELVRNRGKALSREQLIKHLWGENYFGDARNIDTHVKNLRRKMGLDCIRTVKGIGYAYEKGQ